MSATDTSHPPQPTLRRYILSWSLGTLLVVWLMLIALAWSTGLREARKFSDGQLVAVTKLWLEASPTGAGQHRLPDSVGVDHEYLQDVAVMAWENGRLVADTHRIAPGLDMTALPPRGFRTLTLQTEHGLGEWRSFGVQLDTDGRHRRVLALMDMEKRFELGKDIAEHMAQPAILILPLVAFLLWWTIRRGLRPLDRLSSEVAALDGFAGQRLDAQHRFSEFSSTVSAINTMVDTLQSQAQRERQFASDVAHELRTPLAVITLQARAAQVEPSATRLSQLELEALRAGRILTQLLDLARAQRGGEAGGAHAPELPQRTSLSDMAARLISAHAQQAHDSGHDISLVESETGSVWVTVQPMLLELALRNLIENALRHTPTGTQVVVEVWRRGEAMGVSVSDDGQRSGSASVLLQAASGLGLGLRLVERIAEQMGASLVQDNGELPMTTRFSLNWSL